MPVINAFTPETAVLGGLTLGVAAAGRLALNGRVLGISGTVGGLARAKFDAPRVAFTAGLLGAGAAISLPALLLSPSSLSSSSSLQVLSASSYSTARAVAAGALVGAGSALGGGCTSGHGICGNARLSARSAAFTGVMMVAGAAAAAASNARAAVGLASSPSSSSSSAASFIAPYASPAAGEVATGVRVLAAAVGTLAALALAGRQRRLKKQQEQQQQQQQQNKNKNNNSNILELLSEAATGALFSLGLAVSGMLRPSKVVAFLTPFSSGPWDPSLGLVMAGALAVATPAFQRAIRKMKGGGGGAAAAAAGGGNKAPLCARSFDLPTKTAVDARLLGGAALFGLGWGIGGVCPGPGVVAAVAGAGSLYWAWTAAFLAAHALTSSVAVA